MRQRTAGGAPARGVSPAATLDSACGPRRTQASPAVNAVRRIAGDYVPPPEPEPPEPEPSPEPEPLPEPSLLLSSLLLSSLTSPPLHTV